MISYHWASAAISLPIGITIIWLVRRNHLHADSAIWWVVVALVITLVGLMPELVDWIGSKLGVRYPPTLVLLVGIGVLLIKILKTDIDRSNQRQKTQIIAQKLAVLEAEFKSLSEQKSSADSRSKVERTSRTE